MTSLSSSIEQKTVNLLPSRHGKGLQFKMFFHAFSNLNTLFHRQNSSLILQYDSTCTRASRVALVDTRGITYQDNLTPKVSSSLSVSLVPRDVKRRKPGNELVTKRFEMNLCTGDLTPATGNPQNTFEDFDRRLTVVCTLFWSLSYTPDNTAIQTLWNISCCLSLFFVLLFNL